MPGAPRRTSAFLPPQRGLKCPDRTSVHYGKRVALGLVTTKHGAPASTDALKRRLEAAAQYADLDQLCLTAQCGFSSTEEGNLLTEDEQWRKLALIVEVARAGWR